jgi:hypothetical protein
MEDVLITQNSKAGALFLQIEGNVHMENSTFKYIRPAEGCRLEAGGIYLLPNPNDELNYVIRNCTFFSLEGAFVGVLYLNNSVNVYGFGKKKEHRHIFFFFGFKGIYNLLFKHQYSF